LHARSEDRGQAATQNRAGILLYTTVLPSHLNRWQWVPIIYLSVGLLPMRFRPTRFICRRYASGWNWRFLRGG